MHVLSTSCFQVELRADMIVSAHIVGIVKLVGNNISKTSQKACKACRE
jgi:hypothetical protein